MRRCALVTRRSLLGAGVVALLSGLSAAHGQQTTEQFIPIGQSPGLSGTVTSVATIAAVDAQARTITLSGAPPGQSIKVTDRTRIWLDRSELNQANVTGSFADLAPGLKAEVNFVDPADKTAADWIKVVPRAAQ